MLTAAIFLSTMLSGMEFPASPLATFWDRRQYGAESGNWAIAQDSAGIMYFGNNLGVLKYDGSRFRLIPLPNSGAVRSLLYHDNRVFVGGQDEFGYLAPGETGYTEYVSLAASLPEGWRRFADVWSLHALETGVLFQTPEALFVYDGQETRRFETALGRGPLVSAGTYGLLRIDGERLVRVHPDGEAEPLAQHPNWREQRLVAATEEEDGLALITTGFANRAGPWRLSRGKVEPHEAFGHEFFLEHELYSALPVPGGGLLIGTVDGKIVRLDGGRPSMHVHSPGDRSPGVVHALYTDPDGALWAATELGLMRLELGIPVSIWGKSEGIQGIPMEATTQGESVIVTTTHDAYRIEPGFPHAVDALSIPHEVWGVQHLNGGLLFATATGLYYHSSAGTEVLTDEYVYVITASSRFPGRYYLGLADGLAIVEWTNESWLPARRLPGLEDEIWSLAEDGTGTLWAGTPYRGALRFDVDAENFAATVWARQLDGQARDTVHVSIIGGIAHAFFDRRVFAADQAGILRPSDRLRPGNVHVRTLAEAPDGEVWLCGTSGELTSLIRLRQDESGVYSRAEVPPELRILDGMECWNISVPSPGRLLISTSEGLLDIRAPDQGITALAAPRLRRWQALGLDGYLPRSSAVIENLEFVHRNVRFEYSLPAFHRRPFTDLDMQYRSRLVGLDDRWSEWTSDDHREFTNLWEGRYHLEVEARDALGRVAGDRLLTFQVLPPWYRTWGAYAAYLALLALALTLSAWLFAHHLQSRFRRQQLRRERILKAETAAREAQLDLLRFQVNPHFLFNALSMLREHIRTTPEGAWHLVGRIAEFFRSSLETARDRMIPLEQELTALGAYLEIERLRFDGKLEVSIESESGISNFLIPPLLLQPLVENAVKYGRPGPAGKRRVEVACRKRGETVLIEILNTGAWLDERPGMSEGTGAGLRNVRQRLELMFPERHEFSIEQRDGQVAVRLELAGVAHDE